LFFRFDQASRFAPEMASRSDDRGDLRGAVGAGGEG
jgi:hypothetical protein